MKMLVTNLAIIMPFSYLSILNSHFYFYVHTKTHVGANFYMNNFCTCSVRKMARRSKEEINEQVSSKLTLKQLIMS